MISRIYGYSHYVLSIHKIDSNILFSSSWTPCYVQGVYLWEFDAYPRKTDNDKTPIRALAVVFQRRQHGARLGSDKIYTQL